MYALFRSHHKGHAGYEVKNLEVFTLVFINLRVLRGYILKILSFPVNAIYRTVFDGLIHLGLRINRQFDDFDIAGVI
jgi:hypothetical protein